MALPVSGAAGAQDVRAVLDPGVYAAIRKASDDSGTPFDLMMASAKLESGFKPEAQAGTSSASGLFQFTQQTWLSVVRSHGAQHGLGPETAAIVDHGGRLTIADPTMRKRILDLRNDPNTAAAMAGDYMQEMSSSLSGSLGRAATGGEIYLAHFLGVGGAKQMLTASPNESAANVIPAAAQANGTMFYAKDGTALSVSQFLKKVSGKVDQALSAVAPLISGGPMTAEAKITPAPGAQVAAAGKTGGNAPDAPDADTSGWGIGTPTVLRSLGESQAMAALVTAFTHPAQQGTAARTHRNGLGPEMPPAVLTALQMTS